MSGIKILVTGASGFVGSHAIPFLKKKYIVETISLTDKAPNESELKTFDIILHLAGIAHQTRKISKEKYESVNHKLVVDLAKKAKNEGVQHFIFISTVKVYGENSENAFNEASVCLPTDEYARSKLNAEKDLLAMNSDSFTVSIVRPTLVYGKGVKGNLARLIESIRKLPVIPIPRIHNKRSLVYVENLLALVDRIIEKRKPGIFLACDINTISTSQLISSLAAQLNKKVILIPIPGFGSNLIRRFFPYIHKRLFGSFIVDSSVTNQILDFNPPYSYSEGMKRMFE